MLESKYSLILNTVATFVRSHPAIGYLVLCLILHSQFTILSFIVSPVALAGRIGYSAVLAVSYVPTDDLSLGE